MPAYRLPRITPDARQAALRALDAALAGSPAPGPSRPSMPLSATELIEISILDDALDHHLANQLPR